MFRRKTSMTLAIAFAVCFGMGCNDAPAAPKAPRTPGEICEQLRTEEIVKECKVEKNGTGFVERVTLEFTFAGEKRAWVDLIQFTSRAESEAAISLSADMLRADNEARKEKFGRVLGDRVGVTVQEAYKSKSGKVVAIVTHDSKADMRSILDKVMRLTFLVGGAA